MREDRPSNEGCRSAAARHVPPARKTAPRR
jgi:hypothetical protein